jgi:hypothetical protein
LRVPLLQDERHVDAGREPERVHVRDELGGSRSASLSIARPLLVLLIAITRDLAAVAASEDLRAARLPYGRSRVEGQIGVAGAFETVLFIFGEPPAPRRLEKEREARNTVKRYVRIARGDAPPPAARPRVVDDEVRALALELYLGPCAKNATAVTRELHARGITITPRSVQRVLRSMNEESTPPPPFESTEIETESASEVATTAA